MVHQVENDQGGPQGHGTAIRLQPRRAVSSSYFKAVNNARFFSELSCGQCPASLRLTRFSSGLTRPFSEWHASKPCWARVLASTNVYKRFTNRECDARRSRSWTSIPRVCRQALAARAIGSPGYGVARPAGGQVLPDRPLPARRLRRSPTWRGDHLSVCRCRIGFAGRGRPLTGGTSLSDGHILGISRYGKAQ